MNKNNRTIKKNVYLLRKILQFNRIRILLLLEEGEMCACELVEELKLPNNLVSHHLKTLSDLGILKSRKLGLHRKYTIKKNKKELVSKLIKCFKSFSYNNEKQN